MGRFELNCSRSVEVETVFGVDELHQFYHALAAELANTSLCELYLVDDMLTENPHYCSTTRNKMDLFLEEVMRLDCFFALQFQGGGEKYYHKGNYPVNQVELHNVNAIRVYKRFYTPGKHLVHGARPALIVDFWRQVDDLYVANKFSEFVSSIAVDKLQESLVEIDIGGVSVQTFSSFADEREVLKNDPIDIVYTWVNLDDEDWRVRKEKRLSEFDSYISKSIANDNSRFLDNNELLYSLRSVVTYMKGIRNIYIVTDNQKPDFLLRQSENVKIINHKDIFKNKEHLPCYNSHAIASQLHHIPGLANKYLYFNDDIIVGRVVTRRTFFNEYDQAKCFYSNRVSVPPTGKSECYSFVDNAAINNREVLEKKFQRTLRRKFKHTPIAVLKDVMVEIEETFPEIFDATTVSPIRSNTDFSLAGSFYFNYAMNVGRMYPAGIKYRYLNLGASGFNKAINLIGSQKEGERPQVFCVNSVDITDMYEVNVRRFNKVMEKMFPLKCRHELED